MRICFFLCTFDSAKILKMFFFPACLFWVFFFQFFFFMNLLVKIYIKKCDRHNKLWTTGFFNSVFSMKYGTWFLDEQDIRQNTALKNNRLLQLCVLSCILFIQKSSSIFYTEQSCDRLKSDTPAAQGEKKSFKKNEFRLGLPICHKLWDIIFFFFFNPEEKNLQQRYAVSWNGTRCWYAGQSHSQNCIQIKIHWYLNKTCAEAQWIYSIPQPGQKQCSEEAGEILVNAMPMLIMALSKLAKAQSQVSNIFCFENWFKFINILIHC